MREEAESDVFAADGERCVGVGLDFQAEGAVEDGFVIDVVLHREIDFLC